MASTPNVPLVCFLIVTLASNAVTGVFGDDGDDGNWSMAHATYYGGVSGNDGTMGAACGYGSNILAQGFDLHTAALSGPLFNGGEGCGGCYQLQCTNDPRCFQNSVVVTATNMCPQGSFGGWCDAPRQHFDLAVPAFDMLAQRVAGGIPVQYRRVQCERQGGIKFQIMGNPYFQQVLVYNVGGSGDVASMAIKGDNTPWQNMWRSWGQIWQFGGNLLGQSLSISVTTGDGCNLVSQNVISSSWGYGQTFEGSQFP